jgi:hypothetical protein
MLTNVMPKKQTHEVEFSRYNFSSFNFIMKTILLAIILTVPQIIILLVILELQIVTPINMIGWVIFALIWTFYVLLKLSKIY